MERCYTQKEICLSDKFRLLWSQHVYWTRFFIISTAANLPDLQYVTSRLLQNPADFADALMPFYGKYVSEQFKRLFTEHLLIAADLVNAAKNGDSAGASTARKKWYENADCIARFLSDINSFWKECRWKEMLYSHLELTEKEAVLRLGGKFEEDIKIFGKIECEALSMADFMSCGLIYRFL